MGRPAPQLCLNQSFPLFAVGQGLIPERPGMLASASLHVVLGWVSEPQPVTLLGTESRWHSGAWPVRAQKD